MKIGDKLTMKGFQSFEKYNSFLNSINIDIDVINFWNFIQNMIHLKDISLDFFCKEDLFLSSSIKNNNSQIFVVCSELNDVKKYC